MRLTGDVILITGGTGGMGLAMARRFCSSGARVILCDLESSSVEKAVTQLVSEGLQVKGYAADTTDLESMKEIVHKIVSEFGLLTGLVTAAGIRQTAESVDKIELETWHLIQHINVTGTLVAIKACTEALIASKGSIVTVSSVTALAARMNQSAYCVSKAAVLSLTKQVALELAKHGVRVNALLPGVTATPMIEQAVRTDGPKVLEEKVKGSLEAFRPGIPLGRLAKPEEQASAAEFLLSQDASFITGIALCVDGGVSMLG